ncbi:MAG: succinate--CoA ligase subunit alpha, partial [Actinomycetota bacterium]
MSILVGADTRLVVQGLTGKEGTFHTLRNRAYGTQVVAGVTPGKAGQDVEGIPVYDTVADAVREAGATTSMIFVPPRFAAEAILESADAGIDLVVCITEGIPVKDMAHVHSYLKGRDTTLIGPNCPGAISPGVANVGIIPPEVCLPGRVGFVSRSGTLVYQIVHELTQRGIGQSTCVGMGGDPVHGIGFIEALAAFEADPET